VIGAGGVGLSVIMGAHLAGASRVLVADLMPAKLEMARDFGATDTIDASQQDPVEAAKELTGGEGVDYAFEAIGTERTVQEAWDAVRAGGTVVVIGLMPKGDTLTIDPWGFISEKTLKGCFLGSARIHVDLPRLADLYHEGELELDALVSRRIPLTDLPAALDRLRTGDTLRQLVVFD
jgi:S-(hydroxymethyl)glutathione dehydrogenase/alcohol dehydrogenase